MPKPSRQTATDDASAESKIVRTSGQIFADGELIELVASASDNRLDLLFWNKQKKIIAPRVKYGGRIFQAPDVHETLLRAIRFPKNASDYSSARKLFSDTINLFEQYLGLARSEAALVTAWSCSTWFPDCVSSPTTLVISSPDMGPAITLFRLLSCLCRRSLVLADINRSGFLSLMRYQPTLLIHQPSSRKIWDLWGPSNHRGVYVVGNAGRVYDVVGSKAVLAGTADTWSGQAVHLPLSSLSKISPLDEDREAEIANLFRSWFLMYRLRNFPKVRESRAAVLQSGFPDCEIAHNLIACIQGEPVISQAIAPILQLQQQDALARRGCDVNAAIVEVIWAPLHEEKEIPISRIAELTNVLLRCRGERLEYSAEEIGWKLRSLGLARSRNGGGMVLRFSSEIGFRIHRLARQFALKLPAHDCPNCIPSEVSGKAGLM